MPRTYAELIRVQDRYSAEQEASRAGMRMKRF